MVVSYRNKNKLHARLLLLLTCSLLPPPANADRYVDVRTISGFTPLHLAVREGALEAAAALLRAGASLVARNVYDGEWLDCPRGTTPLHLAAQRGNHDMVLLLLTAWVSDMLSWTLSGSRPC
jgi:hypothetical protein